MSLVEKIKDVPRNKYVKQAVVWSAIVGIPFYIGYQASNYYNNYPWKEVSKQTEERVVTVYQNGAVIESYKLEGRRTIKSLTPPKLEEKGNYKF